MRTTAILGVLAIAGSAHAQSADTPDKAAAEALFDQGKKLMTSGNPAAACPKFEESLRAANGLGTMLWLADCYEAIGRTASAWGEFREAAAFAAERGDAREKVARKRAAALEPKLSKLVIVAPKERAEGLEVKRDGVVVKEAAWGTEVPVDPGTHTIVAAAPNKKAWENTVRVPTGAGVTQVTIAPLADADKPAPPPPPLATVTPPPPPPPPQPSPAQRTIGLVVGGVGVVGLGIGTYFGIRAKSQLDDSNAGHCNAQSVCDPAGLQGRDDALRSATISTVAFIAGGALVAGGLVLYFTAPKIEVAPTAGGAALRGVFW